VCNVHTIIILSLCIFHYNYDIIYIYLLFTDGEFTKKNVTIFFHRRRVQNRRFPDSFLVSTISFRIMLVNDWKVVLNTQGTVHKQNDVRFNRENNGLWLGVFNCDGHHAVTGHIELFHHQVNTTYNNIIYIYI